MRTVLALAVSLMLTLPAALAAQVVLRPHDPAAAARPVQAVQTNQADQTDQANQARAGSLGIVGEKLDQPQDVLFVPFYDVDTFDPAGTTTLYAIRNITSQPIELDIRYLSPTATILRNDFPTVPARGTLTVNVRDVPGLPIDGSGRAQGYIGILLHSMEPQPNNLIGDYLQVDVGNNFATGERMPSFIDLCPEQQIRFLDFGTGTELRFLIGNPQGADPMTDPPTMTVTPVGENGTVFPSTDVYTTQFALALSASDFTSQHFGTLIFDFSNAGGGMVYGEYSAGGKFSVGLNSACTGQ